jgi:phosphoglycerol transferase MdoB-like AlkP superfamily enzyme
MTFPFRALFFFFLMFALFRCWFLLAHWSLWQSGQATTTFAALHHSWPLDCSTACYLIAAPIILWVFGILVGPSGYSVFRGIIAAYIALIIALLVLILGANVFVYSEWNTVLSNRALIYLSTPRALIDSMSTAFVLGCLLLYVGAVWFFWKLWMRYVHTALFSKKTKRIYALALPLWLGLLALGMRGGLGVMAINESAVYYSTHLFDNHAATNPAWNLIHSILEQKNTKNSFHFFEDNEAKDKVRGLFLRSSNKPSYGRSLLKKVGPQAPNVIIVLMESMTAQVIAELEGRADVCPNLSRLISSSILFENCYSSGFRTDQGLISVLAGYPAQPDQSIIFQIDKAAKLNSIPKFLGEKGYTTLYCMGGEPTFANIGVWMANQKLGKVISESDFPDADQTQRWGVDDKRFLKRFIQEMNLLKPPFMATGITLSLHPPYDVPHQSKWNGSTDADKFLHSAHFADEAIGQFIEEAKKQAWFEHTLFVFVADHGASHPSGAGQDSPIARRVPLLIAGPALDSSAHALRVKQYGNHHDLPATLLAMLGYPTEEFPWSRDLFTDAPGFGYCVNENCMLWVTPDTKARYSFANKRWETLSGELTDQVKEEANAYLQVHYDDFLQK